MPRIARAAPGGYVYHALNRAVARLPLRRTEAGQARLLAILHQEIPDRERTRPI
jgi:hypothetical protein